MFKSLTLLKANVFLKYVYFKCIGDFFNCKFLIKKGFLRIKKDLINSLVFCVCWHVNF